MRTLQCQAGTGRIYQLETKGEDGGVTKLLEHAPPYPVSGYNGHMPNDKILTKQGRKYLIIGGAILAGILLIVAIIVFFVHKNSALAGAAGALAVATAGAAAAKRGEVRKEVEKAKEDTLSSEIRENRDAANRDMGAVPTNVAGMTDEEKVDAGNSAFGGRT